MTDTREKPSPYDPEAVRRALRTVRDARPDPVTTSEDAVVNGCAHAEMTHPESGVKVRLFACASCIASALESARREADQHVQFLQRALRKADAGELAAALRASEERLREVEASMVSHFQREHLSGDGPEIDRWRLRLREKDEELREAQDTEGRLRLLLAKTESDLCGAEAEVSRLRGEAEKARRDALEEAAKAAEEHLEHMDFSHRQDHHEPPFQCNVAQAIRALADSGEKAGEQK